MYLEGTQEAPQPYSHPWDTCLHAGSNTSEHVAGLRQPFRFGGAQHTVATEVQTQADSVSTRLADR